MKNFIINNIDLLSYIPFFFSILTSAILFKIYMAEGFLGHYGLKLSKIIDSLTFLQLFIIFFALFHIFYILYYFGLYLLDMSDLNISISNTKYLNMVNDTPQESAVNNAETNTPANVTINNSVFGNSEAARVTANGAIISAAVSGGFKAATAMGGSTTQKAVVVGTSILAGAAAIVIKDVAETLNEQVLNNNNSLISPLKEFIKSSLNLTGEATLDLLKLIDFINQLQSLYLSLLIFNFIIYLINLNKLEVYLSKFKINTTLIHYIIKYLKYLQKSSFVMIICLLLLLVISTYLSTYYFHFFYINFDKICKVIIK